MEVKWKLCWIGCKIVGQTHLNFHVTGQLTCACLLCYLETPGMLEEKANKLYKDISVEIFLISICHYIFFGILVVSGLACEHFDLFPGVLANSHQYRYYHGSRSTSLTTRPHPWVLFRSLLTMRKLFPLFFLLGDMTIWFCFLKL